MNSKLLLTGILLLCCFGYFTEAFSVGNLLITNFIKCLTCAKDNTPRKEFMQCVTQYGSLTFESMLQVCEGQLFDGSESAGERLRNLCENTKGRDQLGTCLIDHISKAQVTESEIFTVGKFMNCTTSVHAMHCMNEPQSGSDGEKNMFKKFQSKTR